MNATTPSMRIDASPRCLPPRRQGPSFGVIGGYSVACRSWVQALAVAREDAGARVIVFEPTWDLVDLGREMVERLGLQSRVRVVHAAAMGLWASEVERPAA